MSSPLLPSELAREIVEGMATPVADFMGVRRRPHLERDSCPFPVIVDRNVPEPEFVYVSLGYEVYRHYVLHYLEPLVRLEVS